MSVLVTGMGSVGVNVARRFVDEGYEVVCYDVAPRRGIDFLEEVGDRVEFVRGDILDIPRMLETVRRKRVEGIIHTAIIYPLLVETPDSVFRVTVEGQKNVLEVARLEELKVVAMSSDAVYGPRPDMTPCREDDPTPMTWWADPRWRMINLYIAVKLCGEQLMLAYNTVYGLDTVVVRPCEVFGPGERTVNRPIPYFSMKALRGEPVQLESGGDHAKDFTYAKDLAKGIFSAYAAKPLRHRVFNITGGRLVTLREVAEAVGEAVPGARIELGPGLLNPEVETHRELRAELSTIWTRGPCDITRAREDLGYQPTPFKQAVREYVEWLRRQAS